MVLRAPILAAVLAVAIAAPAAPAHADQPLADNPLVLADNPVDPFRPADKPVVLSEARRAESKDPFRPVLDWASIVGRYSGVTAQAGAWLAQIPELATTFATRLQVQVRDLAAGSQSMLARLVLLVPMAPDLRPLLASPVPGVESSGFGWRRDPIHRGNKFHKGTDFRADRGTPVYAAGAGLVAFTGRQRGYGNVIYVDHGGGLVTRYAHLARIEVHAGAAIDAGGRIGQVGSTGRTTGPHLHFEVRIEGRAVDPTLAVHVAELQRTDLFAAQVAGLGLAPEAQARRVDRHDPVRPRTADTGKRPERRGAPARDRTLW